MLTLLSFINWTDNFAWKVNIDADHKSAMENIYTKLDLLNFCKDLL